MGRPQLVGLAFTVVMHGVLLVVTLGPASTCGAGGAPRAEASAFAKAETIEAALAYKKVEPKDRQPQKQKKETYQAPDAIKLSKDPTQMPEPAEPEPPEKPKLQPREDEIDPASILEKNRVQDEALSSTGAEEVPVEGAVDGSEWGTERDARGDPYVGELTGRIKSGWSVPALEQGGGTSVGCVRLDEQGTITTRELKERSSNANLDRSVEEALRAAPDMEAPVPAHLVDLLTVKGICINFKL